MTANEGERDLIDEAWTSLVRGSDHQPNCPEVDTSGSAPQLRSPLRVEDAAVASVGTALGAAAVLRAARNGTSWSVRVDRGHIAAAMTSERHFRTGGRRAPMGFAPLSRFWVAKDGWVRTHANFPWHLAALLKALGLAKPQELDVESAIGQLSAEEVETLVVDAGGVAAAVRSLEQWRAHPQGGAVVAEPLIGHEALPGARTRLRTNAVLPASGVRVLDLTRVIAGPVCTRYLGALGADVLRIDASSQPDLEAGEFADTLLGKRSACLDLTDRHDAETIHRLLDDADVVVSGYRPGALDRFGLGVYDLAERHGGLVVIVLDAWGHDGPWAGRRGFDSAVQAPTGIALRASEDRQTPGALPCQFLDHGTGYLAAAAVLDGLRRQMVEGGTHVRRLSLARTAHWLLAGGDMGMEGGEAGGGFDDRWLVDVGGDKTSAIAPPGALGSDPLRWPGPPARYLGDLPAWSASSGVAAPSITRS